MIIAITKILTMIITVITTIIFFITIIVVIIVIIIIVIICTMLHLQMPLIGQRWFSHKMGEHDEKPLHCGRRP